MYSGYELRSRLRYENPAALRVLWMPYFFSFLKTKMGKKSEHLLLNERCGGRDLVVNDSRWKGFRGKENLGVGLPCWQCLSSIWSRWSQMKGRKLPFARDYKLNKYFKWNFKHSDKNVQFIPYTWRASGPFWNNFGIPWLFYFAWWAEKLAK